MPLLAALFSAMGVLGGWLIGVVLIGVDDGAFGPRCRRRWIFALRRAERCDQERGFRVAVSPDRRFSKVTIRFPRRRAYPAPSRVPS